MTEETRLRESVCRLARSIFDRRLTHGSSGNISVRCPDGGLLVTPTGSSFGDLDPARLSRFDAAGKLVAGDKPTKEMPLHTAFYETRPAQTGAVVHLHSTHSVAVSMLPETDPDCVLPPLTAYSIMRLGKVKLLPYFRPGDATMGDAVRALAGRHAAVPRQPRSGRGGQGLNEAVYSMEELEETRGSCSDPQSRQARATRRCATSSCISVSSGTIDAHLRQSRLPVHEHALPDAIRAAHAQGFHAGVPSPYAHPAAVKPPRRPACRCWPSIR
jgi:ribulose-5-phosphate 4-epimerase/fuculose-1-phosphate aldolase